MRSFNPLLRAASCVLAILMAIPAAGQAQSANAVAQAELIRRQESIMRNSKAVNAAAELVKQGKYAEAKPIVEKVIQEVTPTGPGATVLQNAKLVLSQIQLHDATEAFKNKEWLVARDQAKLAVDNNPNNQAAKRILVDTSKMVGGSEKYPDRTNPAIDQKFITNINRVNELIKLGQDQAGTGQFDKAEESFQQALAIDRSNKVAANELKKMYAAQRKLAEVNTETANKEKLLNVTQDWTEQYKIDVLRNTVGVGEEVPAIRKSNTFNINQKLKSIIIKNINFDQGTTIEDAASFLTLKSREEDPAKEGVSFLIRSEETKAGAKPFSLNLKNVPLIEALRYITNISGVKYKIEEYAVFIVPITTREETLIRREFRVPAQFFDTGSASATTSGDTGRRSTPIQTNTSGGESGSSIARKALEARGVEFPEGAVALYSPATGILTVLNTQDQIDYIEELVAGEGQTETLMVKVETRIVEINQDDLNSLTFNYQLAGNFGTVLGGGLPFVAAGGTEIDAGSVSAQTNMQGATGLPVNGINQLLDTFPGSISNAELQNVGQNQLAVKGFLDGNGYSILMASLNQKKSFNTITAPSVVVLDQATGTINVSREFRFPTTFEAPQIQERLTFNGILGTTTAAAPTVIPAWPSGFGENPGDDGFAEIGVTSTVTPQIQPNRQSVRLTLNPQVLDFEGFVNYGVPLRSRVDAQGNVVPTDPLPVVSTNIIKIPVFTRRSIDRNTVEIQDGFTLVMGGLIRENIDTLDEKIPFLGDLPLVGRAFRSKTERAVKKNMMIFVTVRIIRPNGEPLNVLASEVAKAK